jgi:hypothetical protein
MTALLLPEAGRQIADKRPDRPSTTKPRTSLKERRAGRG